MSKGDFIALINPAVTFIIATALFILWNFRREHRYVAMLGTAFLCISAGFFLNYCELGRQEIAGGPRLRSLQFTANAMLIIGGCLLISGILARYRMRPPFAGMLAIGAVGLLSYAFFLQVQPNIALRIYAMNFTGGALALLLATRLHALPGKKLVDHALFVLFFVWGIEFFVRTTTVVWYEAPYRLSGDFFTTLYWITLTLSFACFLLILSVILMMAIAMDVIEQFKVESRTDILTGLANRRGFEDHLKLAVTDARRNGLPLTLVIADLDSFKSVNDTYGHAAGDKAIAAFAACLRQHLAEPQTAARVGGEEFAILLPTAEINAARLFAESVRVTFSAMPVEGLPPAERLTASFGIAQLQPQEDGPALMRRADVALYGAKNDGRDRVILAEKSLLMFRTPRLDHPEVLPHTAESGATGHG